MEYMYKTKGTCSTAIKVTLDGDIVKNVQFTGGCAGNASAVSKLVEGMTVDQVEKILAGTTCGLKKTSCPDQLSIAVRKAYEKQTKSRQP